MKTTLKVVTFVALIAVYWAFGGFDRSEERPGRLHSAITAIYIVGAIIALCEGGEPIGNLHPVSLRPVFMVVGALLMLAAFVAMIATN